MENGLGEDEEKPLVGVSWRVVPVIGHVASHLAGDVDGTGGAGALSLIGHGFPPAGHPLILLGHHAGHGSTREAFLCVWIF